jgi:hypothetical protein
MPKIHELIPVEADKSAIANALVDEAINTFSKKPEHFIGQARRVQMFAEDRQAENTSDRKELVETVESKLEHVWSNGLADAIDVTVTKENSNTSDEARADVVVNGKTILSNVPAIALLALEKKLGVLKGLYAAIPTLDTNFAWVEDETATLPGTLRTEVPQEAYKTEKTLEYKVLYEATKEHPAQIEKYSVDRNVGKIITDRISGMVTPAEKARLLGRISTLATAVKEARQRANMANVQPLNVANDIREFIHW